MATQGQFPVANMVVDDNGDGTYTLKVNVVATVADQVSVQGIDANDAPITANPLAGGGVARTNAATQAAVGTGDAVLSAHALKGQQYVINTDDAGDIISDAFGMMAQGPTAHDSPISTGRPQRVGGRARTADYTGVAQDDVADIITDTLGKQIVLPYALPGQNWHYVPASGGIVNGTAVTIKAAAASGIRNKLTVLNITWTALGTGGELAIRDGAGGTVIHREVIAAGAAGDRSVPFPTPKEGSAATLLEAILLTAPVSGAVYVNASGFIAP